MEEANGFGNGFVEGCLFGPKKYEKMKEDEKLWK